jgi:menaquinone-specific isochorismate synthase
VTAIARAARSCASTEVLAFAEQAVLEAARDQAELAAVTIPAPLCDPLHLRALGLGEARVPGAAPALFWAPDAGPIFAGAGEVALLRAAAEQPNRYAAVRAASQRIWAGLFWRRHPAPASMAAPPPRLFDGFAFARGGGVGLWRAFGDASFWLPRWCYGRDGERAWITAALPLPANAESRAALLRELETLLAGVEHAAQQSRLGPATIEELSRPHWRELCAEVGAAIAARECAKVVIARRTVVRGAVPFAPAAVLTRLAARFHDCFAFALARDDATLIGATPERLVARSGVLVRSDALAGSIAPGDGAPQRLLASAKERGEQELVVRAIEASLGPLCAELSVPRQPAVRRLRHVLHLHTPIEGRLAQPVHVLDLVAALHPTPAVGGVPTARALDWIAAREPAPRGWYAAPVGWFDAVGDGEFAVAIRSGLLAGRNAYLYAGAGVVAGSDPDAEYAETGLKQRALLEALGVEA